LDGGGERPHEAVASLSGGWPAVQLWWRGRQKTKAAAAPTKLLTAAARAGEDRLILRASTSPGNTVSPSRSPQSPVVTCGSRSICCRWWSCWRTLNIKMRKVWTCRLIEQEASKLQKMERQYLEKILNHWPPTKWLQTAAYIGIRIERI
jgi:hypothetical protein